MKTDAAVRLLCLASLTALVSASAREALAEPVSIGGKFAVAADASLDNFTEGDATELGLGLELTRISQSGRHELGGFFDVELSFEDDEEFAFYLIGATYRINADPLGPEENIILYAAAGAGVTIITLSGEGIDFEEVSGAGGPSIGAEYYFTSDIALQIEEALIVYEGFDGGAELINSRLPGCAGALLAVRNPLVIAGSRS